MIFYDTETCGLYGMCVLIQWAEDDGPIHLHSVWTEPIRETLNLIEKLMDSEVCGFNLTFDHFHLCKLYTILSLVPDQSRKPEAIITEIAMLEPKGRDGQCLKPRAACDIMLQARKGKYQSTMNRKDISIRKIPSVISHEVRDVLEASIEIDDIYFARRKDKLAPKWKIFDRDDSDELQDIVLKFKASSALKNLVKHALKIPESEILKFGDISVEKSSLPYELGYAPFALSCSSPDNGWRVRYKKNGTWNRGYTWPDVIKRHISHWASNRLARQYAEDDVTYTRALWRHLGSPAAGDDDSELACMVAAVRWKGFKIDVDGVKKLRDAANKVSVSAPKAPGPARNYLAEVMDVTEKAAVKESTAKLVLEDISTWENEGEKHPAAIRAKEILSAREAKWEADLYDKLLQAGKFHASFRVIGALSSRMSGADKLNPQGIKRAKEIRSQFPLAGHNMVLGGGDFDAFEVVLAIAYYGDEQLAKDVQSGKKIHALFGTKVYPDLSYEEILADKEKYTRSKSGVFALIYFGNEHTLKTRLGVPIEVAEKAYQGFIKDYPGIGKGRQKIIDMFQSMRQPGGIGTMVEWHEPEDYIESMFGFKRYFTLENKICKTLFNLAKKPPKHLRGYKGKIVRSNREQSISGAVQSALYAAAFAIQASVTRAAGNHVIQSSGAQITKRVQRKIWDLQPKGIGPWVVQPMNVHDEIMCPASSDIVNTVKEVVDTAVKEFKETVPLIKMEWDTELNSWADK